MPVGMCVKASTTQQPYLVLQNDVTSYDKTMLLRSSHHNLFVCGMGCCLDECTFIYLFFDDNSAFMV